MTTTSYVLEENDILFHVNKICDTPDFKSKKILCCFLRFVVDEKIAGRGDQLKGYTIGIEVLKKDKNFDAEQDSLVRIHAGRLRRSLKLYYLEEGKKDTVRIEIPKGSYQPLFKKKGTELSMTNPIDESHSILTLEPSIAVLPFNNLTGDPDKEYIAYGFSEELSIELTRYEDLIIINSWHRPDIARSENAYDKIGARYMINGSVLTYDDGLCILVKLVNVLTEKQIWAERYSRDFSANNLTIIQEDIADTIAKTVGSEVGIVLSQLSEESRQAKSESMKVFDAILQFYYYEAHMSASLGELTFMKLQEALIQDPSSGVIHAMLSSMYSNAYALDFPGNDVDYLEKMIESSDKAVKLDPENIIVRIAYSIRFVFTDEKERFLREVNHCLSTNITSPLKLGALGFFLSLYGYWERGKTILDKVMNKNIGYPKYLYGTTCLYYYRQKKYETAFSEAEKYEIPGLFWGPMLRACCLGQLGKKIEAKSQIVQLLQIKPDFEVKAKYLISRFVKEEELVLHVLDGLQKAGMQLSRETIY